MDAFAACPFLRAVGLFASMWGAGILTDDASAQTYPNRPIRCIVPYIAGSPRMWWRGLSVPSSLSGLVRPWSSTIEGAPTVSSAPKLPPDRWLMGIRFC